jgi:tetratricopeptide (TPR) repeat protein
MPTTAAPAHPSRSRSRARRTTSRTLGLAALAAMIGLLPIADVTAGPPVAEAPAGFDSAAPLWQPGVLDPGAGLPGRWQQELERRKAILTATTKSGDHRAALALLGLLPAVRGEVPTDELARLVESVRDDRRRHPLVRSLAGILRGHLHEYEGQLDEARKAFADEGMLLSWRIAGPFDNANHGGIGTAFGPETERFAIDQQFTGKLAGEPLEWRPYEPESTLGGGYVSFDEFLRPNQHVIAYATTWVKVPKAQTAVLQFGSGGAHAIWVGTREVGRGNAYRTPDPLQDAYAVELAAGWNRILIKVGCDAGAWGFFAQLRTSEGERITGLEATATPSVPVTDLPSDAVGTGVDPDARTLPAPVSLRRAFEQAAEGDKAKPTDELALVEFYHWVRPFDRDDFTGRDQAREADAAAQSTRSALFLALAEDDSKRSRDALDKGIARAEAAIATAEAMTKQEQAHPDAPGTARRRRAREDRAMLGQMLVELAWRNASLGLERRASELLVRAREIVPDDALIELAAVEQLASAGFTLAALEWVADLRKRYPDSATILREQAGRELQLGRVREGLALLEQHGERHHGDASVLEQRIDAHLQLGEVARAVDLGRTLVAANPGRPAVWRRLAGLEEAAGNYPGAVLALGEALALAPQDPDLHAAMGYLQTRAGDEPSSVLALQRSLDLNPQQPEIRDLLTTLGATDDDVFTRHAADLETVVAEAEKAEKAGTPDAWKGRESAILLHRMATRVSSTGLGERLDQRIIKVLDERGIRSQAQHAFAFDPAESYVEVRRARVMRADGRIEDIGVTEYYSLAEAGYRMYYDQRQAVVEFPGLRVGDVVEVVFVRRDVAARNMFDDYFGDVAPLQGIEPRRRVEYVLETPVDMTIHANLPLERKLSEDGTVASHTLTLADVPGLRPESQMPGWTEVAKYLHVSTYANWRDVGIWYWGLIREQLVVDDAIEKGVATTIAKLPPNADNRAKVEAIYEHVIRSTRYVGLEFGIHGYKPYRTTDIYNRRFGDCKDKASLLKVMLGLVGIEAHLVLVRTRDQGRIGEQPASLSAFNHAIVYVPEFDLFMDGTAEYSGAFELPAGDQGASVVIIEDGKGATFRTIPYSTPDQNLEAFDYQVELSAEGDAKVDYAMTLTGNGTSSWRSSLESPDHRKEQITKLFAGMFPGTTVRNIALPGIEDLDAPVRLEVDLAVPAWATKQDGSLRWRTLGYDAALVRSFAAQQTREHPLELGVPNREQRTLRYELPRGYTFSTVPTGIKLETAFGRFELAVSTAGSSATVETTFELQQPRIEPGDYAKFREFLGEVDRALAQAFEATPSR